VVEIIVALIAVFGAVLPYLFQKNKELNLKIAEQKREAYASHSLSADLLIYPL
jgi:hypothetical protein